MKECKDIKENVESCWEEGGYCDGCEKWDEACCDWAPCSWFCDIIVRGACLICKWVPNIICTLIQVVTGVVCVTIDIVTAIAGALVTIIESALNWAWSAVGFIWGIITSIPVIGRALSWLLAAAVTIVNTLISVPDAILGLLGIMPEKKLRLGVIVLKTSDGTQVVDDTVLLRAVQCAINVFRAEVNVRVIPIRYAQYQNAWSSKEHANGDYLFHDDAPSSNRLLDVCCDGCAVGDDLTTIGADFNTKMIRHTFWGNGRRLIGYGAPIVAFTARSFSDGKHGCSLGPLSDWITVLFEDTNTNLSAEQLTSDQSLSWISSLTHEMAHACNLWHIDPDSNLMHTPPPRQSHLTPWQRIAVRASRHVTYL